MERFRRARIILPETVRQAILTHCRLPVEQMGAETAGTPGSKAFGLLCGTTSEQCIAVADCLPLRKNARSRSPFKEHMDKVMEQYAIPSVTPLHRRGWVADPAELAEKMKECRQRRQTLLGTYHVHRVPWDHDPVRDTPTRLDTVLAQESRLVMFIVSMVNPERPVIRAFYEGVREAEIPIAAQ